MNETIKKNGINFGIIVGLFSVLVTASIYSINLKLFTSPLVGISSLVIYISIGIILILKTKKQLNNIISFKEVFTVYFIAAIIGSTISTLFNIVLFNFIDPQVKETIRELTIKYTVEMMQKFGTPTKAINEATQKLNEVDNFSIENLLSGLVLSFVFSAIFGLILAAIFKSKTSQNL